MSFRSNNLISEEYNVTDGTTGYAMLFCNVVFGNVNCTWFYVRVIRTMMMDLDEKGMDAQEHEEPVGYVL
jgi:hypothetical protein